MVWAVARRKGTTELAPCLAENSFKPSTRIRSRPKPPCLSSSPITLSARAALVKRCDGTPVMGSRHPYISDPKDSVPQFADASWKTTATPAT